MDAIELTDSSTNTVEFTCDADSNGLYPEMARPNPRRVCLNIKLCQSNSNSQDAVKYCFSTTNIEGSTDSTLGSTVPVGTAVSINEDFQPNTDNNYSITLYVWYNSQWTKFITISLICDSDSQNDKLQFKAWRRPLTNGLCFQVDTHEALIKYY